MRILQKKIAEQDYFIINCLCQQSEHSSITNCSQDQSSSPPQSLHVSSIFIFLHSNTIKATSLINVYARISPQRRYNQRCCFEWWFEDSENKVSDNQNIEMQIINKSEVQE